MSEPILPLRQWPAGIQQASVPANDNALRLEALSRPCLGVANDESSPADGDVWLVGDTPTGAFAAFTENDIALYQNASWYAWAPVDGLRLVVNDVRKVYVGESTDEWQDDTSDGISDAPSDGSTYGRKDGDWVVVAGGSSFAPVVTETTTALTADDTNAGNYTRFTSASAKTYTFSDAETYTTGDEYHGRNVGAGDLTLTEDGTFTLNAPADGTLVIPEGGTFTVKIVGAAEADVFGVTVAAS